MTKVEYARGTIGPDTRSGADLGRVLLLVIARGRRATIEQARNE
jgi:hypothetical protein